jgi:hypothetical protein
MTVDSGLIRVQGEKQDYYSQCKLKLGNVVGIELVAQG